MSIYRSAVRPLLFRLDAEYVHGLTGTACEVTARAPAALGMVEHLFGTPLDRRLMSTVMGIDFPNPIGLSAGYDKNAKMAAVLSRMGFGYIDIGSVSKEPSAGNAARPRLFRLPADDALMVFYGVPNDGAAAVSRRLAARPSRVPVGVTLVETNTGRTNDAAHVIEELAQAAAPFLGLVDVLYISAACPNETAGAKPFANLDNLGRLFEALSRYPDLPPVVLKINAAFSDIDRIVAIASEYPFVKGFRPSVGPPRPYAGLNTPAAVIDRLPGSASGPFLKPYLLEHLRQWYARIDRTRHVLIANGGIRSGADAYDAIRAGASLVGIVTALVFEGPGIARRIATELAELLERDGFENVAEAVGTETAQLRAG